VVAVSYNSNPNVVSHTISYDRAPEYSLTLTKPDSSVFKDGVTQKYEFTLSTNPPFDGTKESITIDTSKIKFDPFVWGTTITSTNISSTSCKVIVDTSVKTNGDITINIGQHAVNYKSWTATKSGNTNTLLDTISFNKLPTFTISSEYGWSVPVLNTLQYKHYIKLIPSSTFLGTSIFMDTTNKISFNSSDNTNIKASWKNSIDNIVGHYNNTIAFCEITHSMTASRGTITIAANANAICPKSAAYTATTGGNTNLLTSYLKYDLLPSFNITLNTLGTITNVNLNRFEIFPEDLSKVGIGNIILDNTTVLTTTLNILSTRSANITITQTANTPLVKSTITFDTTTNSKYSITIDTSPMPSGFVTLLAKTNAFVYTYNANCGNTVDNITNFSCITVNNIPSFNIQLVSITTLSDFTKYNFKLVPDSLFTGNSIEVVTSTATSRPLYVNVPGNTNQSIKTYPLYYDVTVNTSISGQITSSRNTITITANTNCMLYKTAAYTSTLGNTNTLVNYISYNRVPDFTTTISHSQDPTNSSKYNIIIYAEDESIVGKGTVKLDNTLLYNQTINTLTFNTSSIKINNSIVTTASQNIVKSGTYNKNGTSTAYNETIKIIGNMDISILPGKFTISVDTQYTTRGVISVTTNVNSLVYKHDTNWGNTNSILSGYTIPFSNVIDYNISSIDTKDGINIIGLQKTYTLSVDNNISPLLYSINMQNVSITPGYTITYTTSNESSASGFNFTVKTQHVGQPKFTIIFKPNSLCYKNFPWIGNVNEIPLPCEWTNFKPFTVSSIEKWKNAGDTDSTEYRFYINLDGCETPTDLTSRVTWRTTTISLITGIKNSININNLLVPANNAGTLSLVSGNKFDGSDGSDTRPYVKLLINPKIFIAAVTISLSPGDLRYYSNYVTIGNTNSYDTNNVFIIDYLTHRNPFKLPVACYSGTFGNKLVSIPSSANPVYPAIAIQFNSNSLSLITGGLNWYQLGVYPTQVLSGTLISENVQVNTNGFDISVNNPFTLIVDRYNGSNYFVRLRPLSIVVDTVNKITSGMSYASSVKVSEGTFKYEVMLANYPNYKITIVNEETTLYK
jgi:hypothetical protein